MKIIIPGGSGQVGTILARHFHHLDHEVVVLSRKPAKAPWRTIEWDAASLGPWTRELESADVVFNLAGRSVNCRYTPENRKAIMDSRVNSTRVLGEAIATLSNPPGVWLNASTATIYRHSFDTPMDEDGELGGHEPDVPEEWHFSIDVATRWEKTFFLAPAPFTRRVALRSAMTMSPDRGGVFDELLRLARFGLGGTAGSGDQYVSWIHEADFIRAIDFIIAHGEIDGPINVASPNPLPNREFMRALREAAGVPFGVPSPNTMVEIGAVLLGTESELILKSRRVVPARLKELGFNFEFPDWPAAARDLVARWRNPSRQRVVGAEKPRAA